MRFKNDTSLIGAANPQLLFPQKVSGLWPVTGGYSPQDIISWRHVSNDETAVGGKCAQKYTKIDFI